MKLILKAVFQIFFISALYISPVLAEQIPGTPVLIKPPAGFEKTDQFPGYINPNTGSSIIINTIPGPFNEVKQGFGDPDALRSQSLELMSSQNLSVQNKNSLLLNLSQKVSGVNYLKWMLLIDMDGETLTAMAVFPAKYSNQQSQTLKNTILNLKLDPDFNPVDSLSFTIKPSPPFGIAKIMGNNVIISPSKVFPIKNLSTPFMIVGTSVSKKPGAYSNKEYAVFRATKIKNITFKKLENLEEIKIDGLSGYLVEATGYREETINLSIYQVILYALDRYYLFQGITPMKTKDKNFPKFIKTIKSFKQK